MEVLLTLSLCTFVPFPQKQVSFEEFKYITEQLESSGNKNTEHKWITSGLHANYRAVGKYGLMLLTAKELAKTKKEKDSLDYELVENINDQFEWEEFVTNNPNKYNEYSERLLRYVYNKAQGDAYLASVLWRWGHNLSLDKARTILRNNPMFIKRIDSIKPKQSPQ